MYYICLPLNWWDSFLEVGSLDHMVNIYAITPLYRKTRVWIAELVQGFYQKF